MRCRLPMQRKAPAAQLRGRQRAKLQPAQAAPWEKMLEECGRSPAEISGPNPCMRSEGRTLTDDCPEPRDASPAPLS